jgi:pimeloyl-ACP methyl ester carboxylesterase
MKKIIVLTMILISMTAYGQIDTPRVEFFENELLRNIHQINTEAGSFQRLGTPDPIGPFHPIDEDPLEPCTLKRLVFFLHGLGGDNFSWERAANAMMFPSQQGQGFSARYCESIRLGYPNAGSTMIGIATDIRQQIITQANIFQSPWGPLPGYNPDQTKNFIIAHSQGGVVARTLMHNDLTTGREGYGGLVTVASSLQGARIINNRPALNHFIGQACTQMLAGPVAEQLSSPNPVLNFVLQGFGKQIVNSACNVATSSLVPELLKDMSYPAVNDYECNASHLAAMNAAAHNDAQSTNPVNLAMPKIAFYGVEPMQNLIWRTFNWMVQSPNNVGPWEANDDFGLLNNAIYPLKNNYATHAQQNHDAWVALENKWYSWWPGTQNTIALYKTREVAWQKGVDWIAGANSSWTAIIGALVEVPLGTACNCICLESGKLVSHIATDCSVCQLLCPNNLISSDPFTLMGWTYKDNDGVVLAESAQEMPYATHLPVLLQGSDDPGPPPTGSSHMQIRNDDALRKHLTLLLNGDYNEFFFMTPQ